MTHCPPPPSPVPFQIAAEGRGTPPCKPGFSEDTYKVVLPDMVEKGRALFTGESFSLSAGCVCVRVTRALLACVYVCVCVVHLEEDQNSPDMFKQLVFAGRAALMWFNFLGPSSVSLTC